MRPRIWLILILQAALVSLVVITVRSGRVPLGVPGEWEWLRVKFPPVWQWLCLAGLGVAAYAAFVALGIPSRLPPYRHASRLRPRQHSGPKRAG